MARMYAPLQQGGSSSTHISALRWSFNFDGSYTVFYRPCVLGRLMSVVKFQPKVPAHLLTTLHAGRDIAMGYTPGPDVLEETTDLAGPLQARKEFVSLNSWPFGQIPGNAPDRLSLEAKYQPVGPEVSMHWGDGRPQGRLPHDLLELCLRIDNFAYAEAVAHFPKSITGTSPPRLVQTIYLAYHKAHTLPEARTLYAEVMKGVPHSIGMPWLYDYDIGAGENPNERMQQMIESSRAAIVAACPDFETGSTAQWELQQFRERDKQVPQFKIIWVTCQGRSRASLGSDTRAVRWEDQDRADQVRRGIVGLPLEDAPGTDA